MVDMITATMARAFICADVAARDALTVCTFTFCRLCAENARDAYLIYCLIFSGLIFLRLARCYPSLFTTSPDDDDAAYHATMANQTGADV